MAIPQVELLVLRAFARDVSLLPGTVLGARVLDRGHLSLAGVRLAARLPEGLEDGTFLRVQVREATPDRLVLAVVDRPQQAASEAQAPQSPAALAVPVPLPGGASARLLVNPDGEGTESGGGGGGLSTVTVRYESPGLGRVDLALSVAPGLASAQVHAPAGEAAARLREGSAELRDALGAALARPARVAVAERRETLDVQA